MTGKNIPYKAERRLDSKKKLMKADTLLLQKQFFFLMSKIYFRNFRTAGC
jgi:hypothetical protein